MSGFVGFQQLETAGSAFNAYSFLVRSILTRVRTATLVKVMAVTNSGEVMAAGTVDIMPLVNQTDGAGKITPHATIYACPYMRVQGGANAVILDPQVGDIGIAVFADRDISSVQANRGQANPGSRRQHDMADGLYIGAWPSVAPTQYVQFTAQGITVTSPTQLTINAPLIALHGQVTQTGGTVSLQGPVTVQNDLTAAGTSVHTHTHGGVQAGSGNTSPPL